MKLRYQISLVLFCMSCFIVCENIQNSDHDEILDCQQKSEELRAMKKAMQLNKNSKSQEVFSNVQTCGRSIVDIVLLAITAQPHIKKGQTSSICGLSVHDRMQIVKGSLSWFLIVVEVARAYHGYREHKRMIESMTYEEFTIDYPQLVIVCCHVSIMKALIALSASGTFPQQIFARIQLVKMSLPQPYEKYANKCAKKLYQRSFDSNGCFQWVDMSVTAHPYKKFYKKVPQDFKGIAYCAQSFPSIINEEYLTPYAVSVANDYNDVLIHMIYAGMQQEKDRLYELRQMYDDSLVQRLYQYYVV